MTMRWRTARGSACLVALSLAGGCATARMELPADMAAVEPIAVQGRQGFRVREGLRFGGYSAVDVRRSWTSGRDVRIDAYAREQRAQEYGFTLRENDVPRWTVECEARVFVQGVEVVGVDVLKDDRSSLDCQLEPAGGGDGWRLGLEEERERPLSGALSGPDGRYDVVGTNHIEGGVVPASQTTGYELRSGERVVGAVEVISGGAVRLRPELGAPERTLLAAAAAALLLLEDLRATLEVGL